MTKSYSGNELQLFEGAVKWKAYWASRMAPWLGSRVLEVGAGLGGSTSALTQNWEGSRWVCLEPDNSLRMELNRKIANSNLPTTCVSVGGTLVSLNEYNFDTILYLDVLEHIEDDKEELRQCARYLASNGFLIVLAPAHQILYSPFDQAIGHFRRYNARTLRETIPAGFKEERLEYLDCLGIAASLANRLLLRWSEPTKSDVLFWDRRIVPISRKLDGLLGFTLGKSLLGVWRYDP